MEKLKKLIELYFNTTKYDIRSDGKRNYMNQYKFNKSPLNKDGFIIIPRTSFERNCQTGEVNIIDLGSTLHIKLDTIHEMQRWVPMKDKELIKVITSHIKESLPEMKITKYQVSGFCSIEYFGEI